MQYLFESAFCLTVLYGFYWLLLRRETFFQWNRWYLLLAPFLAFAIPAVQIQLEKPQIQTVVQQPAIDLPTVVEQAQNAPLTVRHELDAPVQVSSFGVITMGQLLQALYRTGAGLLGFILLLRMWKLFRFIRNCRKNRQEDYTLALATDDEMPVASFFSFVFWHKKEISEEERLIIEHELVHARQWHSLDVLFMELLVVWQWFNPLIYLYRRSLQAVHEYIADDYVVRRTKQRHTYASLLAQQYLGRARPDLVNTFHAQLKDRLLMLAKHPSNHVRRAKFALAFPLAFGLMLLFSFRLIERIPGAAPVKKALQQAELFTQRLSEITIAADKPASAVAAEPTPYIFYWGAVQAKLMREGDRYTGEVHLSVAEFREAVKREPRLWNGQSLEQHLTFDFKGKGVRSDYENESVYMASRKTLEPEMAEVKDGEEIVISKIGLPGGKTASVRLVFDQGVPNWIPIKDYFSSVTGYASSAKAPMFIPDHFAPKVDWKSGSFSPAERQFCTVQEFWDLMETKPLMVKEQKEKVAPTGYNVAISKDQTGFHFILAYRDGGIASFDSLKAELEKYRDRIQPGVHISIQAKSSAIKDSLLTRDGKLIDAFEGFRNLGDFDLVEPNSPLLKLTYKEKNDYTFEWGNHTERLSGFYGDETANNLIPTHIMRVENPNYFAREILDMLQLQPRLYREKTLLKQLSFTLLYKDKVFEIQDGTCPPEMYPYIKNNIQPHDLLTIKNIKAAGVSIGNYEMLLDVKPNNPKPPLKNVNPSAVGSEQAFRLLPPTPNPATDNINLTFYLPNEEDVVLTIVNLKGQIVWTRKGAFEAGNNTVHLRAADLQGAGMYVVTLQTGGGQTQEQLVVQ